MSSGEEQIVEALRTSLVEVERVREINRRLLARSTEPSRDRGHELSLSGRGVFAAKIVGAGRHRHRRDH